MDAETTRYRDLPVIPEIGLPHAWNVFGREDEVGTLNLLTDERRLSALRVPTLGRVFNLSLPLNMPDPPMFGRQQYRHHVFSSRNGQDDYLDGFYLQGSSQLDGLRHVRAREFGFYGGRQDDEAGASGSKLGIEHWASRGVVGRGVLLDVSRHLDAMGTPVAPWAGGALTADLLREVASAQGVHFSVGDILMVRTGWMGAYLSLSVQGRAEVAESRSWVGLEADAAMAEFLWDNHFAALVVDNPAVEHSPGDPRVGSLHRRMIPLLGMAMGEFWNLEELAKFAAESRNYYSLLVSVPLNIPGGVGSPANAIAVV